MANLYKICTVSIVSLVHVVHQNMFTVDNFFCPTDSREFKQITNVDELLQRSVW